ncbi:hypothetical protein J5U23_00691 [Saccharolobus shibatae B12]|uniref:Uncharacterized protein n=1 Tax=Saccharolobus shibatae (strain ATCC 51178 / DSM 5389 / JCM 8931 / NBRC 15437 / B12) TaxID=523848 RepID=A0A8F5GSE9_SACSH|nr:hypothetical protein [Saccharolobus shibatae]QXJ27823.1 hypothetical protein J5U23_00691 [Saccharolobus shibatae B12]
MKAQIQFGENWVKVNDSIFYTTPHGVQILKAWYESKVGVPEEYIVETLEYLAKAFSLLKPQDYEEAAYFLEILEDADVYTNFKIKEIIDRIYANKTVKEL